MTDPPADFSPRDPAPCPVGAGERERRLLRRAAAFGLGAALVALSFGPRIGLSVTAGAAVTILGLLALRRMVAGLSGTLSGRAAVRTGLFTLLRHLLLGAALVAIISVWNADPIGVVCGLGAPLLAVLLEVGSAGFRAFRGPPLPPETSPPGEAENPPAHGRSDGSPDRPS